MQQRIRSVKPPFFRHGALFDLEQSTGYPMRLVYLSLWSMIDRAGRFEWKPRELKLCTMPYDTFDYAAALDALAVNGYLVRYTVGGKDYGYCPTFTAHQSINARETPSTIPPPPPIALAAYETARIVGDFGAKNGEIRRDSPILPIPEREKSLEGEAFYERGNQPPISNSQSEPTRGARVGHGEYGEGNGIEGNRIELNGKEPMSTSATDVDAATPDALAVIPTGSAQALPSVINRTAKALSERLALVMAEVQAGTRQRLTREQVRRLQAETVFSYWVHKSGRDIARTKIDDKRERYISARLAENGGDVSELLYAVDGSVKDPHLQGHNDRGKRYDNISLIFRDREHVEELASLCKGYKSGEPHKLAVKYQEIGETHEGAV